HSSIPLSLLLFPIFPKAASSVVPPSPGSHSLCYNITVLSQDGSVQSRFFAEGYLDRQAFLHYDHKKGRAEPWGQWAEKLAAETLETEYTDLNATWKELRKLLEKILSLQEEKGDDSGEGARVLWAIFLEEVDSEEEHRAWPRASLALCFLPTEPPAVNVTCRKDSEGMVYLTCEAFDFFPCNISVLWFRDEEPMSRDAQEFGDVLRDGNGTYYTWETIRIPQGEELRVKCIVEHSGNHSTHLPPLVLVPLGQKWLSCMYWGICWENSENHVLISQNHF
uniref:Ig-like domain-containing protein n=1 Tax=Bos indicus x Bos taurus TaxID=30522 RepID=A0A4W2HV83_BOBOX